MHFKNSKYFHELQFEILKFRFGTFYLCQGFFISELSEGIHFDWPKTKEVMTDIIHFYGKDAKLAYLSNRINSYSLDPHCWGKLEKHYGTIVAGAIVSYNNFALMNATLEKSLSNKSIKRCNSLNEGIAWILNLREFN